MAVRIALSLPILWAVACSDNGASGAGDPFPEVPGMAGIRARGKSFFQGSAASWAAPDEGPRMRNSFSYDFHIDTAEVTQGLFRSLMGFDPVSDSSAFGAGDAHPVYNVTWFDAALFCNARSKAAGLDTVYAYSDPRRSARGNVYELSGFSARLDKTGFRLPTEAEWEFAARAGATGEFPWGEEADSARAKDYAWYAVNSAGTAHPVAGLKPNAFGLYDMAGNVMEWVNDWKGRYPASGREDFAGSRDPGPESDAPVKGGAFKYGLRSLRPASRTATYATVRPSLAEYVGFRCALGAIPQPRFATPDGGWSATEAVRLELTRLGELVGGRPAKLVFVNATQSVRHLVYVDYRRRPAAIREYVDAEKVFHPAISPDGNWVAYGTAGEGSETGSQIYVRALGDSASAIRPVGPGFIPRWWVDPASRDTFLIYTGSASDNTQDRWSSSRTLMQKMGTGLPVGSPALLAPEGFHDGRSSDGRWLATGFRLLKIRDGADGVSRILFTAPSNGKDEGDTSQVCNVSIAPDATGRTLFLDFGFDGRSGLTGSAYGVHQVAFLADTGGAVLRWYRAPEAEAGWEDLEWSNAADYAVSAATDATDRHRHLYLLDLRTARTTLLAEGAFLATPGLWLGPEPDSIDVSGLSLDSLGRYNVPAPNAYQEVFASRMALFWKRHAGLEVLFTGSSHVFSGIDPSRIKRFRSLNMGYPANGWLGQEEWVARYALNHCPDLKVLVMEAFPGWLHYPGGDFSWLTQMGATLGVSYDRSHGFWKEGLPARFGDLVARATDASVWDGDSLGFLSIPGVDWGGAAIPAVESEWDLELPEYQDNMKRIEAFAALLAQRKIHLVLVNFPTSPAYKGNVYYGPYGPRLEVATGIIARFRSMEAISPYVHFYDANDFNDHDYSDEEAINSGHLDADGAAKLTTRLDSLIQTFAIP